ncbi:MAG: sulfate reduction electron transfer complex DsrMKJOP subunit DsrO [Acidobacteriota bacterium]
MSIDRRRFLKIAGLTGVAGLAIKRGSDVLLSEELPGASTQPAQLTARRWAMVIDPKKCLEKPGCTDCIKACHYYHNVPSMANPKDEIKWIWEEPFEHAFLDQENEFAPESLKERPILVFCNHCDKPPCVRVCPTKATWKREDGIVMMDWHRCIGCRYCMVACPYGSRSFNWRDPRPFVKEVYLDFPTRTRGVVEKCNFCEERLAKGLLPACVDACKQKALVFGDLEEEHSEVRELLRARFSIRRKPILGTSPQLYYLV